MLTGIYLFVPVAVQSQSTAKVENINFYAEGSKLVVTYDIVKAKPGETFDVWIKVVTASGKQISPMTLSGNYGSGNIGGSGKKITWNVEADNVVIDEEFSVEVYARSEKKPDMVEPTPKIVVAGTLTAKDVFTPEKNTFYWMGIDYSHVRVNCEMEPTEIKNQYFEAWNQLVLDEAKKYNIKEMFKLKEMQDDINMITSVNLQASTNDMAAETAPNYSLSNVASFVGSYPSTGLSGIGIVFIAEYLGKKDKAGIYHVVAINLANNEVLLAERMQGEPGGMGFRNYWAGSVYNVILLFEKDYKNLKARYSK
jgi:hypothetical protein